MLLNVFKYTERQAIKQVDTLNRTEDRSGLEVQLADIKNKIIILSGKGGVGKTTVAVNIAYSLALKGYEVGLLDVDIHGPNICKMLGVEDKRLENTSGKIEPIKVVSRLKAISTSAILETPDTPVIWRGPLKMKAIRQFLEEVNWGKLDYMIIDSPPGTGDEPLSVMQLIPDICGAIIVTTPQEVAMLDSRKSVQFAKLLKIPFIGIVENMSGLICPYCKKEIFLFKKGGGGKAAKELDVEFLGSIPIEIDMVDMCDQGRVLVKYKRDCAAADKIDSIVEYIKNKITIRPPVDK